MRTGFHIFAAVLLMSGLSACASSPQQVEKIGSVEALYNEAMNALENKDFLTAVNTFEELERQHPYSGWATRAQMMTAYAHYRQGNYDEAVATAERFIRLHPGHKDLPYVHYLRGMSFYNRIRDVKRDQSFTLQALQSFEELRRRYPDSLYARDAKLKITLCRDHLAGQEMMVGRYYQDKAHYLAAIKRFNFVVDHYQTSSHIPEALYRLTESYLALGVNEEAKKVAAVLGHNYPSNRWYADAYDLLLDKNITPAKQAERSWLNQIGKGVGEMF